MNNEAHVASRREERHAYRGMTGWFASWARAAPVRQTGGRWKCEFPKTTKNNRGGLWAKQQRFCSALSRYLLEPEGEPAIVPEREYKKKEGRWDFIYAFAWRHSSSFIWLRWRWYLDSCSAKGGWLPSFSNLLILPKPSQRAHHIWMCGAHWHTARVFSSNLICTYLFILSLALVIHSERDRLHPCMLQHFPFLLPLMGVKKKVMDLEGLHLYH